MPRRQIGQETLLPAVQRQTALDEILTLTNGSPIAQAFHVVYCAPRGEASWPPLAMFKGLLLSVWYDLSDVKLAEALDDRASFRWFCT